MKKSRLLEIIREEISSTLNELTVVDKKTDATEAGEIAKKEEKDLPTVQAAIKTAKTTGKPVSVAEEDLNEIPDFGGQLDQGVATKYGEEDTLQKAVDDIVGETLADMGITLNDLKKDEAKATEALTSIREKVLGAKRKGISQDPRVVKALEKQQDIEIDKLGAISGKDLQANQTNNALKKALGLITPDQRGRKADPNKPEKPASTGKKGRPAGEPKAEKIATRTKGDDGMDNVSYSDVDSEDKEATQNVDSDSTAKELGATANVADKFANLFKAKTTEEAKNKMKELAKRANSGDQKAKAFFDNKNNSKIIQAYRNAQKVKA
jgi:hypothetical protein